MLKFIKIIIALCLFVSTVQAKDLDVMLLDEYDMSKALTKEFAEQGLDNELEFEFYGGKTRFELKETNMAKIMISNLMINEEQNKFMAEAEIFADGKEFEKTTLNGKYYTIIPVYVPAQDIAKGTTISTEMLKKIKIRANRVKPNIATEKDKIVGLQAKKSLKEGKLIVEREVGAPLIIRKGNIVMVVYKSKGLQITSKAEALEDGAQGQRIEFANLKSTKKFKAKIINAETVEIDNE